ncbi:MAG TPA: relaxase/mobilization nuclease RlxS [Sphingopyxis sp.]|nr:relaxase/mobilization nuclease RlxS [Sphingopyxis sp.]
MSDEKVFEPRLGRIGARGKAPGKKYLHRILAAANLAGAALGQSKRKARFDGSRIGRGAGVGRVLGVRDEFAAFRRRRVIVKSRIVKLAGKGAAAARAHLRYVERDGTTRDGGRGRLYDAESDAVDGKSFLARGEDDRHHFRFIVSPEDGAEYDDLKSPTRRLMAQMEADLGTALDWVAVDHFNTGHPHTHIIVRGKDDRGKDLIIAREYITGGMRERAAELIDLDLGPRSDDAVRQRLRSEIEQDRLTGIDRALLREAETDILVGSAARGPFDQTLRIGRLRKLERLGLAEPMGATHWRLVPGMAETLRRMGERGDIIRTMQRAFAEAGRAPALADQAIYDPAAASQPIVGRIRKRGLSDEVSDRHYLMIDAADGRTHYVDIGKGENLDVHSAGAVVRITPTILGTRDSDRTVAEVAAANRGRYNVDLHLRHDPAASEAFAETHVRRLEAIRRRTGGVTREADGSWIIAADHLDRAAAYEAARAKDRPVVIETLSIRPIEHLVDIDAATWLDRELVAADPVPLRDAGFGRDARVAQARRRQWLVAQGLAWESDGRFETSGDVVTRLRQREVARVGARLSKELGRPYTRVESGDRVSGILGRRVDLVSGRYALIERARDFTLVPWRSVLDRQLGKSVTGIVRGEGMSWTFGRGRGGPNIS